MRIHELARLVRSVATCAQQRGRPGDEPEGRAPEAASLATTHAASDYSSWDQSTQAHPYGSDAPPAQAVAPGSFIA